MSDILKLKTSQLIFDLETKAIRCLRRAEMAKAHGLMLVEKMERDEAEKLYREALRLAAPMALEVTP